MDSTASSSMAPKPASSGQMAAWGNMSNPMAAILGTLGMGLAGAYSKSNPQLSQMAMLPLMYKMLGRGNRAQQASPTSGATAPTPAAPQPPVIFNMGGAPQASGGGMDPTLLALLAQMGGGGDPLEARRRRAMQGVTMGPDGQPPKAPGMWQQMMTQGF